MRDFVLLFKTLYKNNYAKIDDGSGKKRMSGKVAMILSTVPLLLIFVAMLVMLTLNLHDIRSLSTLANVIVTAVQMLTLFLSLGGIVSTLYSSKDTPLLSSLPLRPSAIFMAKFSLLYVNALKFSSVMILPMLLSVTVTFNIVNKTMFYGIYPFLLIILLFAPILPLFIVTLFSMPVVWIGSYFKGKSTLKSVLTIIFYLALMACYMVFVYYANTSGFGQNGDVAISDGTLAGMSTFASVMYPNKVLLSFCYGIDFGKNFGISIAITLAMIVVMILLSMLFYKRINIRRAETRADVESKNTSLKQSGVVASLVKRDFKMIIRNSGLAMTSFANLLMAPIFIVLMYFITRFKGDSPDGEMTSLMLEMMNIGFVVMYSMIFLGGANTLSAMAYTREGSSFFASKSLPIAAKDSIKAKFSLSVICAGAVLIPVLIIALALYRIGIVSTLIMGVDIMLVVCGVCGMNIVFDMKKGNQYWKDATELRYATKGNTYQIISAFVAIIPAIAIFILGIVLSVFEDVLSAVAIKAIYWSVATVFSAIVCTVGLLILKNYGEKYFDRIGEHKPQLKQRKKSSRGSFGGGLLK